MKRFLAALLALLLLIPASGMAAVDLSSLSWQELQALDQQLAKEMASRPEWKEVIVPPGVYEIGVDIPEGYWDISRAPGSYFTYVEYTSKLDASKTTSASGFRINCNVISQENPTWSIMLTTSNWIIIEDYPALFTPHVRPNLGF